MAEPRGLRNNNPGNIEAGAFASSLPGYEGSDGRFAIFATPEDGLNAISELLDHYGRKGYTSVNQIINRWAPSSENNTRAYINDVAAQGGFDPNAPLDFSQPGVKSRLIAGIVRHENGEQPYTPQQLAGATGAAAAPQATVQNAGLSGDDVLRMYQIAPSASPASGTAAQPAAAASSGALSGDDVLKLYTTAPQTPQVPAGSQTAAPGTPVAPGVTGRLLGPASSSVGAFFEGAANGIPIVGPAIQSGLNKAAAAVRAIRRDEPYSQALNEVQGEVASDAAAHPTLTTAGNVAGAVAGTAPLAVAAPEAFGISKASLPVNMLIGAGTGGAIGGADAGVRSGFNPGQTLEGGAIGFGAGALGPVAGRIVGAGVNKLIGTARDFMPASAATQRMLGAIADSGSTPDAVANALMQNPRLAPVDVNPNLLHMGMGLAADGGAPRATISNFVANRAATAPEAVESAFDASLGEVPDVRAYLQGIKHTAQQNAANNFGSALAAAKPVDVSGVLKAIDDRLAPGVNGVVSQAANIPQGPTEQALARVRSLLTDGTSTMTDADRLHVIQQQLRIQADTLAKSASGQERLTAQALRDVRGKLVNAIDDATGGQFKPAQKQYADDLSIDEAFDRGLNIFRNRSGESGLTDRPEYWQAWMDDSSPAEQNALKLGVRVAADQQINAVRNAARKGAAIPEVGFNGDKLAIVLGKDEAAKLTKVLADEQTMANTHTRLMGGSDTDARNAARTAIAVPQVGPVRGLEVPIGFAGMAGLTGHPYAVGGSLLYGAARKGTQALARLAALRRNALLAEWLTATGENANGPMNRLMAAEAAPPQFPAVAANGANLLTNAGGQMVERNRLLQPVFAQ